MSTLEEHTALTNNLYHVYQETPLGSHIIKLDYKFRRLDAGASVPCGLLNLGCLTGKESGMTVVEAYHDGYQLIQGYDVTAQTAELIAIKFNGDQPLGVLFFYGYAPNLEGLFSNNVLLSKVAIRNDGQYAVLPPSMNMRGNTFKWVKGELGKTQLTAVPEKLLRFFSP